MHAEVALCERNVDAEQTQGERVAGIHKTRIERRLDADQTHTEPGFALNLETSHHSSRVSVCLVCVQSVSGRRSVRVHSEAGKCLLRACTVFALRSHNVYSEQARRAFCTNGASTLRSPCVHVAFTLRSL